METDLQSVGRAFGADPIMRVMRVREHADKIVTVQCDEQGREVERKEWPLDNMAALTEYSRAWHEKEGTYATIEKADG